MVLIISSEADLNENYVKHLRLLQMSKIPMWDVDW